VPVIVDHAPQRGAEPITIFESGAILLYLAERTCRYLSREPRERMAALQWLFWQVGGLGPMAGQAMHFRIYAPHRSTTRWLDMAGRQSVSSASSNGN
jgi:GST-like protein